MKLVNHPHYKNPEPGNLKTIPGDTSKQHATDAVYAFYDSYTDELLQCERCLRYHYFFAEEKKYWYEELGFWVDAKCIHCVECRRMTHKLKDLQHEYENLQKLNNASVEQIKRFRVVAKTLIKIGLMKDVRKVDKLG